MSFQCKGCDGKLQDVIKRIPDCMHPICGNCYESIKKNKDESNQYKCPVCKEIHTFTREMPDDLYLKRALKPLRLTPQALQLKETIEKIEEIQITIEQFDKAEKIEQKFNELEQRVTDAFESAREHLNNIERGIVKQIEEFRAESLETAYQQRTNKIEESEELSEFLDKWKIYFQRPDGMISDQEIEESLKTADAKISELKAIQIELLNEIENEQIIDFYINEQFFMINDNVGEIKESDIAEKKLKKAKEKDNEENYKESTKLKKEALSIYRRLQKYKYNPDRFEIAQLLQGIAVSYFRMGDKQECANFLKESMDICLKILKDNPNRNDISQLLKEITGLYSSIAIV